MSKGWASPNSAGVYKTILADRDSVGDKISGLPLSELTENQTQLLFLFLKLQSDHCERFYSVCEQLLTFINNISGI